MRRSPFYGYPAYPFRTPHSNLYDHGPYHPEFPQQQRRRPYTQSSTPSQPSRSVIHIPVFDSASPAPPPSPPQRKAPVVPILDSVSAATRIQSYFRGYSIRRHHPLVHLRNISASRKRLEDMKSELESPEFSEKVKSNDKERLRFSESVMAIILQLDAIEGAIPEVRNQRKEATKMAIKLQDSMDAIMSPQEERTAAGSALAMVSERILCFDVDAQQEGTCSVPEPGSRDGITTVQEATAIIQEEAADQVESRELEEQDAVQNGPAEGTDDVQENLIKAVNGAGIHVYQDKERSAAQDDAVDPLDCVENDTFCRQATFNDSSEGSGIQAAEINGKCLAMASTIAAPFKQADQTAEEEMSCMVVDDTRELSSCALGSSIPDKSCQTIDVCQEEQEVVEVSGQGSIINPDTPCAEDQIDAANPNMDDSSPMIDNLSDPQAPKMSEQMEDKTLTRVNTVSQDSHQDSDALHGGCMVVDEVKEQSNWPLRKPDDKSCQTIDVCQEDVEVMGQGPVISPGTPCAEHAANWNIDDLSSTIDKLSDTQALKTCEQLKEKTLAGVNAVSQDGLQDSNALHGEFPPSNTVLLKKLSEECGQLKLMLGKLLAQNKAQSKVICALGDRLEMLEHQQKLGCQSDHRKVKRKMKKGSKMSVRYRNDDQNWN